MADPQNSRLLGTAAPPSRLLAPKLPAGSRLLGTDGPSDEEVARYDPTKERPSRLLSDPTKTRFQVKGERQIERTLTKGSRILAHQEQLRERYGDKVKSRNLQMKETGLGDITVRDMFNFLVGDDLKVTGAKWDQDGFSWSMENMKQTWSEDPMWLNGLRTLGLGLSFLPAVSAVNKSLKVGKLGKMMGKGFKFVDWTVDQANPVLKESKWFEAFPQKSDEMKWLKEKKFLNDAIPDADISDKTLQVARQAAQREQAISRKLLMRKAIKEGEDGYYWAGQRVGITKQDKLFDRFDDYFANKYWEISNATMAKPAMAFNKSLKTFFDAENVGRFFRDVPAGLETGKHDIDIVKYWHDPVTNPLDPAKVDLATQQWATGVRNAMEKHQIDMTDLGAFKAGDVPDVHVPAQFQFTKAPETKKGIKAFFTRQHPQNPSEAAMRQRWPDLDSMTLKERKTELPAILQRLDEMAAGTPSGPSYIVDPREVTLRGLYVDRQIYHNLKFMKDFTKKSVQDGTAMLHDAAKVRMASGGKMAGWVHLENMPAGKEIFRRVLQKNHPELIKDGQMPWISKAAMDQFFGPDGLMFQTEQAGNIVHAMVAMHKSMKTVANIPTHLTNAGGNLITQMWTGFNPLDPRNMSMGKGIAGGLFKVLRSKKKFPAPELFEEAVRANRIKLGEIEVVNNQGKKVKFNLNDHFSDATFKDLMEMNSFDEVEGAKAVKRVYDRMKPGLQKGLTGIMVGATEAPGVKQGLDKAGQLYLAEDFIPKAQLYFKYLADGLSKESAGMMVARYMPMYRTTGDFVTGARKFMLPWVTYPSEVLRIAKNQMMDNPLKLMPWLHAVDFMQTGLSGLDGMNYEGTKDATQQLPFWARTPNTVVAGGKAIAETQGVIGGGLLGGALGTAIGGGAFGAKVPGVGPVGGAIAGAAAGWLIGSKANDEVIRGATLNMLPLSALQLGIDPEKAKEYYENMNAQKLYEALPVQPFSILKPIMDVMSGQTAFGEDIGAESGWDQGGKIWAGLVGFMSPPAVQTYGFKITSPEESWGWMGLAGGAAVGAAGGAKVAGAPGAVVGAAIGGLTGANINTARIGIDTGTKMDPRTMHLKEAPVDFILNNFGAVKSYAALPENQVAAKVTIGKELTQMRTYLKKQAHYEVTNNDESAKDTLAKVQATFSQQYPMDPKKASNEFADWLDQFLDGVGESPMMKGLSKDEMKAMQRQLRKTDGNVRTEAMENLIDALKQARRQ